MQESEIAGSAKALGQDVLQDEPQEVRAVDGSVLPEPGLCIAVAEADGVVVVRDDVLLADDAAVEVASQIDERGLAGADMLAVDDPFAGSVLG